MKLQFALTLGLYISAGTDFASTRYGIHNGATERNPIAGQSIGGQAAVAFGSAGAMHYISRSFDKEHPKLATALKVGFIAARGFTTYNNIKIGLTSTR